MDDLIAYQKHWHQDRSRKKRRIMRDFHLAEISSVDVPAMEGAVAVLMKRYDERGSKPMSNTPETFEEAVDLVQKRSPALSRIKAKHAAARTWPDLLKAYNEAGELAAKQARAKLAIRKSEPARRFEALVDRIQERDGSSRLAALEKAAKAMDPDEFERYRRGLDD